MGEVKLQSFIDIIKQQCDVLAAAAKFSPERIDAVALDLLTSTARVVSIIKESSSAARQELHASRDWLLGEVMADVLRGGCIASVAQV
jgi:hypothetical protein